MSAVAGAVASQLLPVLTWHRLRMCLVNTVVRSTQTEHPLAVFDAMVRQGRRGLPLGVVLLRTPEERGLGGLTLGPGRRFTLELLIMGAADETVEAFVKAFRERLYAFTIDGEIAVERVAFESREVPDASEICLWFRTPLPVRSQKGRMQLGPATLCDLLAARVKAVLGVAATPPPPPAGLRVLSHLARYTRFTHVAKSSAGNAWLQGHVGPILLRGDYRSLWPWLCLCEQIGLGKELGFGFGQFSLEAPAPPVLTARWGDVETVARVAEDIVDRYDSAQVELAAESAIPFDAEAFARAIAADLTAGSYVPKPHQAFIIGKRDGGTRRVEFPAFRDLVVAQHLKKLLDDPLDALFETSSLGYRKGHSQEDVATRIDAALGDGFAFVVESDIDDFFPSIDHGRLEGLLRDVLPAADAPLVDAVMRLVRTGYVLDGVAHDRERGVAQGNPLSPLLANLYLDAFDEAIGAGNVRLVRYADDFVILTRTQDEAASLLTQAEETLRSIGLQLKEEKTRIAPAADGFTFLGVRYPRAGEDPQSLPVHGKKPLYVTQPGVFLAVNGDAVTIRKAGVAHDSIPLRRVSEIFVFGYGAVSNALLRRCAGFGVPISFCLSDGYHVNTVAPDSRLFFEVSYRQSLRYWQLGEADRLEVARMIVRAKIANAETLFRQRHNEHTKAAVQKLEALRAQLDDVADLTALRGLEGLAARTAFGHWAGLIDVPGFEFTKRVRERPDRINSLLNFGYHLLFARLNSLVRGLGLNPYLGFLHESGERYETLVCDLQEPFRANVERLILTLINQHSVKVEDFEETRWGLRLTGEASRSFALAFERMLARPPRGQGGMPPGSALYAQVLSMKRYLCDGETLQIYRWQPPPGGE